MSLEGRLFSARSTLERAGYDPSSAGYLHVRILALLNRFSTSSKHTRPKGMNTLMSMFNISGVLHGVFLCVKSLSVKPVCVRVLTFSFQFNFSDFSFRIVNC